MKLRPVRALNLAQDAVLGLEFLLGIVTPIPS
jgi:hypothetical protein